MVEIKGSVRKEIPDPAHANCVPNWWKVVADVPQTFTGETEIDVFERIRKWEDCVWHSTCNGLVPSFTFADKEQAVRYRVWLKGNPIPITSYSQTF